MQQITLYSVVKTEDKAQSIIANGFPLPQPRDVKRMTWVTLFNVPQVQYGRFILEVVIESTSEELFRQFEITQPGETIRTFVIKTRQLKVFSTRLLSNAELEDLMAKRVFWNEYPPGEPEKTWSELE